MYVHAADHYHANRLITMFCVNQLDLEERTLRMAAGCHNSVKFESAFC